YAPRSGEAFLNPRSDAEKRIPGPARALQEQGGGAAVGGAGALVDGDLLDRHDRDPVVRRELAQHLEAGGFPGVVEHLARDGDGRQAGEDREIDGRLGVAATLEGPAGRGPQREDVTRPLELGGARVGVDAATD